LINPVYLKGKVPPIKKSDFPHFKPYLEDSKLPGWAENLQDKDIKTIVACKEFTVEEFKQLKEIRTVEIDPQLYNDPEVWKLKRAIWDHSITETDNKRTALVTICRKIQGAFDKYEADVAKNLSVDEAFNPGRTRQRLEN
jgi:hypothetical protein